MAQLVEHHLAKVRVAGSNPVVRSKKVQVAGRVIAGAALAEAEKGDVGFRQRSVRILDVRTEDLDGVRAGL